MTAQVQIAGPVALPAGELVRAKHPLLGEVVPTPAPGGEVPTEFRIFRRGANPSADGVDYQFTDRSAHSVLSVWKERRLKLHIDYEHSSEEPSGAIAEGAPAAGWFDLAVRDGELWAVNIEWTPRAAEFLRNREYRYFSPVFFHSVGDFEIGELKSIALTNIPRLDDLTPLVATDKHDAENDKPAKTHAPTTPPAPVAAKDVPMAELTEKNLKDHADKLDEHGRSLEKCTTAIEKMCGGMEKMTAAIEKQTRAKDQEEEDDKESDGDSDDVKRAKAKRREERSEALALIEAGSTGDAAVLTPGDARELNARVKAKQADKAFVRAFISEKKAAKASADAAASAANPNPEVVFDFGERTLARCKSAKAGAFDGIDTKKRLAGTDARDISRFTLVTAKALARTSEIKDADKRYAPAALKASWDDNAEREREWRPGQLVVNIPDNILAGMRSLSGSGPY